MEDHILSLRGRYTLVIVTHNLAQVRRLTHELTAAYIAGIRG